MKVLTPAGADFCKLLRSSSGQQVLLMLMPGQTGPMITGTTTFEYDGQHLLAQADVGIEKGLCETLIRNPLTAQQELGLADQCIQRLTERLKSEIESA
jgi:hypothetical protein